MDGKLEKFIGPGSNPAIWDIVLFKLTQNLKNAVRQLFYLVRPAPLSNLTHLLTTQGNASRAASPDETFGFGDMEAEEPAPSPEQMHAAEDMGELNDDEEWEEVDLDEFGMKKKKKEEEERKKRRRKEEEKKKKKRRKSK